MTQDGRRSDWKTRLTAYVVGVMQSPFKYGRNDCALFCAGAVKAMTGKDYARGWRGYRSLTAGMKKLKAAGYTDHIDLAAEFFSEVPVSFAQPGDLAVVPGDEDRALGVVQGEMIYVLTPEGVGLVPLLSAERAFRV